jgi:hypothetical protein
MRPEELEAATDKFDRELVAEQFTALERGGTAAVVWVLVRRPAPPTRARAHRADKGRHHGALYAGNAAGNAAARLAHVTGAGKASEVLLLPLPGGCG